MGDKEYKLTASQGQFLLQWAAVANVPDKLGDQTFTATDRAIIQGMMSGLFSTLKRYSPYAQEYEPGKKSKLFFGDKDNWEREGQTTFWHMKDPDRVVRVRLSKEDANAAAWCAYLAAVPRAGRTNPDGSVVDPSSAVSPSELADTVIPMLKAIGKYTSVMNQLGVSKFDDKKHGWNDEPLPADEAVPAKALPEI